jgi:predicted DNA-binding transcriptional regulator YafY
VVVGAREHVCLLDASCVGQGRGLHSVDVHPGAEPAGENTSAYRYQARFTLHASAATAAERIAPTTATLEPIDEHSCTLRAGSNSLDELAIYVAGKGFDFQVHEPPELVEHVKTLASRLARATDY